MCFYTIGGAGVDVKRIASIIENIKKASNKKEDQALQIKINNIKHAFIKNWERDNLPFIQQLVEKIDLNQGIPLPILSICGQGTQEIRFTKYLSYFLDPSNNHGLQDKLLKILLSPECKGSNLESNWSEDCKVIPEIYLGQIKDHNQTISCYADIGIEGQDYIIIVEQKILSSESKHPDSDLNQLERYNLALNNNPHYKDKQQVKIYLTPKESSSADLQGWLPLTHKDLIDRGINLLKSGDISRIAKENLARLLLDLAVGPYEVLEESLDEMILLGNYLMKEKLNIGRFVRFNKLINQNEKVIEILMEG